MNAVAFLVVLLIVIGIFLLVRELWCWYYKSNAILEKLNKLEADIEYIKNNIGKQN